MNNDLAGVAPGHVAQHQLGQVHGRAHVQVDDGQIVRQLALDETAPAAHARVQRGRVQPAITLGGLAIELLDALGSAQIDLYRPHVDTPAGQAVRRRVDAVVFGGHHQVITALGEQFREFESDSARRAGDHCQSHSARLPVRMTVKPLRDGLFGVSGASFSGPA